EPLVPRRLRFELHERMISDGRVLRPVDEDEVRAVAGELRAACVESVAVCLLHSYRFPEHEQAVGRILRTELPDVTLSLSSDILREQREYERSATTVVNAYVRPLMGRYVADIRRGLDGASVEAPLTIMQSSGGVMTSADATERPVLALESGPAAGVADPPVPDANLFLGYIPTGALASGDLSISADLAEQALESVAEPLGLSLADAAAGVHAIANARMTRALRSVSSEKGRDPRDFVLIAYGGSGPVHALGLAEELGCRTVLVPALAGLFSSLGLLFARPEFHDVHSCHLDARAVDAAEIARAFDELEARLAPSLEDPEWIRSADLRYGGQSWEVEVEFTGSLADVLDRFEDA